MRSASSRRLRGANDVNLVAATTQWLEKAGKDLLFVWLFVAVAAFWSATHGQGDKAPSAAVEWLCSVGFATCLTSWVMKDALQRRQQPCYDYDSFVFSAWMLIVPLYLFQSRGVKALITMGWFALLVVTAMIVGAAAGIPFGTDR